MSRSCRCNCMILQSSFLRLIFTRTTRRLSDSPFVISTRLWKLGNSVWEYVDGGLLLKFTITDLSVESCRIEEFKKFEQPSRRFMQFEEQLLTDNKGDQNHYRTVTFRNCMLRIPGSLNPKWVQFNDKGEIIGDIPPEAEVRIIQLWDGNTPSIIPLLKQYYIWLQDAIIMNVHRRRKAEQKSRQQGDKKTITWIEKLLDKPLDNFRKYCISRIFALPQCKRIISNTRRYANTTPERLAYN